MTKSTEPLIPDDATNISDADYMRGRVVDQIKYYEKGANKNKTLHVRTQILIIGVGVLVPVVLNLPDAVKEMADTQMIATVLSLFLAILSGVSGFRKWGELWLSYRLTEELLKQERNLYLTRSGDYRAQSATFQDFVERIESIVSSEHQKFRALVEESRRPVKKDEDDG